jgi:transcriptional regulator with XRE-family HTH domain
MGRPRRAEFHSRLAERRQKAGLTQQEVADRLGTTAELVRRHEKGLTMPQAHYRREYCLLFGATEEELGFRLSSAETAGTPSLSRFVDEEDAADILARLQRITPQRVNDDVLLLIQGRLDDVVRDYEDLNLTKLTRSLVKQRQWIGELLDNARLPRERQRLYTLASRTSGLLGYAAVNQGRFSLARAYCTEAFHLGDFAGDAELQSWARGTQSFCEYYAGNYEESVRLARDGLDYAGEGVQSVRLAINGEARALGKLRDADGVHRAVERAYAVMGAHDPVAGVSSCVSFGGYSLARTASNAVTAYVALGLPEDVQEHASIAMPEFEASDSKWSQSLIRLDLANSLVTARNPELERASELVREALDISTDRPITSVLQRGKEFVLSARRLNGLSAVRDVQEAIRAAELR